MEKKLTLVVTCTERKSLVASPELQLRNFHEPNVERRAALWAKQLASTPAPRRTLMDLYQGETWAAARRVATTAERRGYETRVLVASAGLGLRSTGDEAPGYAATFSPRQPDSCGSNQVEQSTWWSAISDRLNGLKMAELRGRVILILSEAYARALNQDLEELGKRSAAAEVLLFGGARDIAGVHRVPAVRDMRSHLRGTTTALNARAAETWLNRDEGRDFWSPQLETSWSEFVSEVSKSERYDRTPMADKEVIDFITGLRATHPRVSKSDALRRLRDSGRACEQKRFGRLFEEAAS